MNAPALPAKTIVSAYYEGGWFGSNYTMNLYKGCCHGCIYCDSRSQCYGITDFDRVKVKENALAVVENDLRQKRRRGMVITGSMSDPYNPLESALQLTRGAMRLLDRYGFGVAVDTKSPLAKRDGDLLAGIARHSPACVNFTVTAADDGLSGKIERHVAPTSERLEALACLARLGVPCGVLLMPILPFITDTAKNVLAVVNLAARAGAKWVYAGDGFGVTLRDNQRGYYYDRLDEGFPGLKTRYMQAFGNAYFCSAPENNELFSLFRAECERLGLMWRMGDISAALAAPYRVEQLRLF